MKWSRARIIIISAASASVLLAAGTAAGAAITGGPIDGSHVIYGCFTTKAVNGSHALVLQDVGTTCPSGTTAITWNQQGATGPQGPAGPQGPQGAKGDTGAAGAAGAPGTGATVGSLVSGDPNCATGGASVTDGNGKTAYACNGAIGPKGATGDPGPVGAQGAPGSPGAPGTGATVAAEPSGANCANGGASVTDGSGTTAYACNGATGPQGPPGTGGLSSTTVYSTARVTVTPAPCCEPIPGLTQTVTVPPNGVVLISTDGGAETQSNVSSGNSAVDAVVFIDGARPSQGPFQRLIIANTPSFSIGMLGHWAMTGALPLSAGQHTISVEAGGVDGDPAWVGGGFGDILQSTLTVTVLHT